MEGLSVTNLKITMCVIFRHTKGLYIVNFQKSYSLGYIFLISWIKINTVLNFFQTHHFFQHYYDYTKSFKQQ